MRNILDFRIAVMRHFTLLHLYFTIGDFWYDILTRKYSTNNLKGSAYCRPFWTFVDSYKSFDATAAILGFARILADSRCWNIYARTLHTTCLKGFFNKETSCYCLRIWTRYSNVIGKWMGVSCKHFKSFATFWRNCKMSKCRKKRKRFYHWADGTGALCQVLSLQSDCLVLQVEFSAVIEIRWHHTTQNYCFLLRKIVNI